jgi:hypothetical protein
VVENPHKSKIGLPQYHKCQAYGHTKSHKLRYVKYEEEHLSDKCSKDNSLPAKCALCAGAHTSSYIGCPVNKKHAASFQKQQKEGRLSTSFSKPTKPMQSRTSAVPTKLVPTPMLNNQSTTSRIIG